MEPLADTKELDRLIDALGVPGGNARAGAGVQSVEPLPTQVRPLARALLSRPGSRESLLNLRKLLVGGCELASLPQEAPGVGAVASILGAGPGLGRLLASAPRRLAYLTDPTLGRAWSLEELAGELDGRLQGAQAAPVEAVAAAIASFRNDHYVRLAACEFGAGSAALEQVGLELSSVADLCLDRAMRHAAAALALEQGGAPLTEEGAPCGLVAIGMGKYGAQELNFCSDIDLVFIYETDRGRAGALTLHEFFGRVCQQVVGLLDSAALEGFAYKVDLRLRPEGNQGPICNALASAERYYETWGGPYDRLAWLKARPVAGALALGRQMIEILRPFVFPRGVRPEVLEQIQQLNTRIGAALPAQSKGWNVKLGAGGIRAVEFFVQVLQLLHAGQQPALQARATLPVLDRLLFAGFITEREHRQLAEAYELWRRIEHRLQLYDGRQTHGLPEHGPIRQHVVAHLGYSPAAFDEELLRRRRQVQAIYDTLAAPEVGGGEAQGVRPGAPDGALAALAGVLLDAGQIEQAEQVEQVLIEAGFTQPGRAAEQLGLLASKPWGPLGAREASRMAHLGPVLLSELSRSPDPDAALHHLVEFSLRFGPYTGLWELLDDNRLTLRLLCNLFGSSDYLARLFIGHPELLDQLLLAGRAQRIRGLAELDADLAGRLRAEDADGDDPEARLNGLRRFKNEELLRIGLNDIAGGLEQEQVWQQLSDLAQTVVAQTFAIVLAEVQRRYGRPRLQGGAEARMAIIALGKLGGQELTYASDLDLIFIYSGPGQTDGAHAVDNGELFSRLAQRLINALGADLTDGRLYEVDARLRPSGNQGTLVTSWPSFQDYHRQAAQLWERQVLIKARAVAGDQELGCAVERWLCTYVYDQALDGAWLREEMHRHRRRMEKELAAENGAFYNLKLGRGGLLDIDFIVQYLQLCHGGRLSKLRERSTLRSLEELAACGLLDSETATTLTRSYRFLRRIESRLRIVRDRSAARFPSTADGLEVMARRLGYRQQAELTPGSGLLARYQELTGAVRECYERVFGTTG